MNKIEENVRKVLTASIKGGGPGTKDDVEEYVDAIGDAGNYDLYTTMEAEQLIQDFHLFIENSAPIVDGDDEQTQEQHQAQLPL